MAVDLYFTLTQVWVGLWIAAKVGPPSLASHHAINYKPLLRAEASSGKSPQLLVPKLSTTNWNCNTNQDCQSPTPGSSSNCTSLSPHKLGFDNLCVHDTEPTANRVFTSLNIWQAQARVPEYIKHEAGFKLNGLMQSFFHIKFLSLFSHVLWVLCIYRLGPIN